MRYILAAAILGSMMQVSHAAQCMPCIAKCSICFNAGKSTFPSIAACEANCKATGNRPALATCGVRAACPAGKH
jgi:hypothetical protein